MLNMILDDLLREARMRWKEVYIDRVKVSKSKVFIYMSIEGTNIKAIIYRNRIKVRVYCRLKGMSISLQRMLERIYKRTVRRWKGVWEESI